MPYPYLHKIFSSCTPVNCEPKQCDCCDETPLTYTGVNLACSGIETNMELNEVVQLLDNQICLLKEQIQTLTNDLETCCNTTTTTTTSIISTTTTTTTEALLCYFYTIVSQAVTNVFVSWIDCNNQPQEVELGSFGDSIEVCALLDSVNGFGGGYIVTGGIVQCIDGTTSTTTTVLEPTTTTTTTELVPTTTTTTTNEPTTTTTTTEGVGTTTTTTTLGGTTSTTTTIFGEGTTTTTSSTSSTTSTTTTSIPQACIDFELDGGISGGTVNYTDCLLQPQQITLVQSQIERICALEGTVSAGGTVDVLIIGICP